MKKIILIIAMGAFLFGGGLFNTDIGATAYQRADAQIEAANTDEVGHALISITNMTNPGDTTEEGAVSYGAFDSDGNMKQVASISAMWGNNASVANGFGVLRFNADTVAGGSDIAMRIFGTKGISFWGGSDSVSPGGKFIQITRTSGLPSISGSSDIVIEGNSNSAGTVFLNAYHSGDVNLNLGGGTTIFNGTVKLNSNVVGCPTSTTATRCLRVVDTDGGYSYVPLFR